MKHCFLQVCLLLVLLAATSECLDGPVHENYNNETAWPIATRRIFKSRQRGGYPAWRSLWSLRKRSGNGDVNSLYDDVDDDGDDNRQFDDGEDNIHFDAGDDNMEGIK